MRERIAPILARIIQVNGLGRVIHNLRQRLYFRRADGCTVHAEPHSHHLTRLGELHFIGRWPVKEL